MILDKTADIFRQLPDANDADYTYYQPWQRGIRINIQPESEEYQALHGATYGRTYRAFLPPSVSGVRIGDKIAVSGTATCSGMEYSVRGVADWNMPPLPHFELRLEEAGV